MRHYRRLLIVVLLVTGLIASSAAVASACRRWHSVRQHEAARCRDLPTTTTLATTTTAKPITTSTVGQTTTSSSTTTAPPSQWKLAFDEEFNTDVIEGPFLSEYSDFDAYPYLRHDTPGFGLTCRTSCASPTGRLRSTRTPRTWWQLPSRRCTPAQPICSTEWSGGRASCR
jgi:hypothetical protein